jgi:hypothetical protein
LLLGRVQHVGDFRLADTRKVTFLRSPRRHARLQYVHIDEFRNVVFKAKDLTGLIEGAPKAAAGKVTRQQVNKVSNLQEAL